MPFDLEAVEMKGDPIPVLEGVVTRGMGDAHFSLAEDGTLVYVPGTGGVARQRTFVWVDREGQEEPVAAEPGLTGSSVCPRTERRLRFA